ncbi:hypothetical protein EDD85DRAFT_794502 [Armillaria nabsnona]|nr:hypothetical protein EDD85DRAFT_794502 [Armillaria nabsnona]
MEAMQMEEDPVEPSAHLHCRWDTGFIEESDFVIKEDMKIVQVKVWGEMSDILGKSDPKVLDVAKEKQGRTCQAAIHPENDNRKHVEAPVTRHVLVIEYLTTDFWVQKKYTGTEVNYMMMEQFQRN